MPEICRFYGIVITMYWNDHNPPHFHAIYGEFKATIDIRSLSISEGSLPRRASQLVLDWPELHQQELVALGNCRRHVQGGGCGEEGCREEAGGQEEVIGTVLNVARAAGEPPLLHVVHSTQ